jgi:hypothetical protein
MIKLKQKQERLSMIERVNKIINNLIIITLLLFSSIALGEQADAGFKNIEDVVINYENREGEKKYQNLDAVFSDFGNRMVLGVFGKTALVYFISEKIDSNLKSDIAELSENEMKQYSKPFNYVISSMVFIVLKSSLLIILIILVLYFSWMIIETLFRTQDAGEFLGSSWSKLFSPMKMGFAVLMITPMFGDEFSSNMNSSVAGGVDLFSESDFSLSQVFMLRVLGESNNYANKIWEGFVDSQEQYYPAITMPNVTSKRQDFVNFIDYVVCLSSSESDSYKELNFTKTYEQSDKYGPYLLAEDSSDRCSINIKIPFDLKTYDYIKTNNFLEDLGVTLDYESAQLNLTSQLINESTPKVKTVADNIISMISSKNNNLNNVNDFSNQKIYEVNEKNWRLYCDDIFNGGAMPEYLTGENIGKYKYYASNCLSKDFVMKSSKLSNSNNLEYPYSDSNYLKKNKVEMCVSQRIVPNGPTLVSLNESSENSIQKCINNACANGSAYECSSVLNFAKSITERDKVSEKGWILSGAYAYKFFSSFQNAIGMSLIEDININFKNIEKPKKVIQPPQNPHAQHILLTGGTDTAITEIEYFKENDASTAFTVGLNLNLIDLTYEEYMKHYDDYEIQEGSLKEQNSIESFLVGEDGFLGIKEFLTCVKNPLSITEGYQCGNVTEETQGFGIKLLVTSIELKVIKEIFKGIKGLKMSGNKGGSISNSMALADRAIALFGIAGSGVLAYLTDNLLQNISTSGSFSQVEYDLLLNRDAGSLAALTAMEMLLTSSSGVTDFIITVTLVLGVLLGIVLPLMPYFIFLVAFSGFMILFFESLITVLVWAVLIISPSGDHSSDYAKKGVVMILTVFLRAPLIVFGLVSAWLLNNILIGEILSAINIEAAFMNEVGFSIKTIIDIIIVFGVQVFMLYLLYSIIFSIIEGFYDISQKWLFGSTSASPFGDKNRGREFAAIKGNVAQFKPGLKKSVRFK